MIERRTELRMNSNMPVRLKVIGQDQEFKAVLVNVSLSGALVRTDALIELGRKIELYFENEEQRIPGSVIRVANNEIGIVFDLARVAIALD